ncbi:hypothetical protein Y032_0210g2129 [Ancylostoma ceylanicum]|uniref:Uncharacterized protein n=1 Tax=Ancylostoma ceylanicum TaxID=53326 RepID=A0A016SKG8_9BILA|nr:hypothetical protein Y032_0210g2129 [Ancylostoma ceylanicum]
MHGIYEIISCPLGKICVAEIDQELCALMFDSRDKGKELARIYPSVEFVEDHIANAKNVSVWTMSVMGVDSSGLCAASKSTLRDRPAREGRHQTTGLL